MHWFLIKLMQTLSESVHWFWNCDNVKSLMPKSFILRNCQIEFSSYSPYWRVACFKYLIMKHKLFVCVTLVFFWCRNKGRNWFNWKAKIDSTPFGKVAVPKNWTSSKVTHFRQEGHICSSTQDAVVLLLSSKLTRNIKFFSGCSMDVSDPLSNR